MKANYDIFFDKLLKVEGGFTDDPHDRGNKRGDGHGNRGSTNLGVTAKVWAEYTGKPAPIEVMKKLTKDDVKELYHKNYWLAVSGDHLPNGVDISVADFGVNSGPGTAVKYLQRVVGATQDGAMGPQTLGMVHDKEIADVLRGLATQREAYLRSLKTFERFGRGWLNRNEDVLEKAMEVAYGPR
jgi:lysozyme family protein